MPGTRASRERDSAVLHLNVKLSRTSTLAEYIIRESTADRRSPSLFAELLLERCRLADEAGEAGA